MCGYLTVYVCLCSVHRVIRLPSEQQNDSSTQNSPTWSKNILLKIEKRFRAAKGLKKERKQGRC